MESKIETDRQIDIKHIYKYCYYFILFLIRLYYTFWSVYCWIGSDSVASATESHVCRSQYFDNIMCAILKSNLRLLQLTIIGLLKRPHLMF